MSTLAHALTTYQVSRWHGSVWGRYRGWLLFDSDGCIGVSCICDAHLHLIFFLLDFIWFIGNKQCLHKQTKSQLFNITCLTSLSGEGAWQNFTFFVNWTSFVWSWQEVQYTSFNHDVPTRLNYNVFLFFLSFFPVQWKLLRSIKSLEEWKHASKHAYRNFY